jgi:hypothetical protein
MTEGAAARLPLVHDRAIDERARDLVVLDVCLVLENPQDRLHGAVADGPFGGERCNHVAHCRGAELPEDGHHAGLGVGECWGGFSGHMNRYS